MAKNAFKSDRKGTAEGDTVSRFSPLGACFPGWLSCTQHWVLLAVAALAQLCSSTKCLASSITTLPGSPTARASIITLPVTHKPIPPLAHALYKRTNSGDGAPSRLAKASDMADLKRRFLIRMPLDKISAWARVDWAVM